MRMWSCELKVALAGLALGNGDWGEVRAQEAPVQRVAQLYPSQDPPVHNPPADTSMRPMLPPAMTESAIPPPRPAQATAVTETAPRLADFERIAIQRNPTLKQAAAQIDATMNRSFQAGLYPNPTVGYVQEQIGTLGEVTPTASGITTRGRGTPGELVGGFVQQEIVTGGKLRLSRAKFAEEANAARWQAEAQILRVLNGVRVHFFEVLAAQRLLQIQGELARLNDDAVRTTDGLVNVGQANEPDLLQAKVEARRARVCAPERGEPFSRKLGEPGLPGRSPGAATDPPRRKAARRNGVATRLRGHAGRLAASQPGDSGGRVRDSP